MKTINLEGTTIESVVSETVKALQAGKLVVAPSDTVYGLLVDATNEQAVKKLIEFKNRPIGKAISVFIKDVSTAYKYIHIESSQEKILRQLLPGPFTIVLSSYHKVSRLLEAENGSLGIRVPDYQFIAELTKQYNIPITATSANLGGRSPHYSIDSLLNDLPKTKQDLIDLVIDAGKLPRNKPSTVIDLTENKLKILRKGDVLFSSEKTYTSTTPSQTKKIAHFLIKKMVQSQTEKPLIILLEGDLGVGKTIFVKGIAEHFHIDNIISPTYVIYYEYAIESALNWKKFYHFDLYNIQQQEEFEYLGIEKLLMPGNILCFEWGEKSGELLNQFKTKARIVSVKMKHIDEKKREIQINF